MSTNHIFVDFENVQPKNFALLSAHNVQVTVFIGAAQKNLPIETATALQTLGDRAKYCIIPKTGANALDFHIACYLGRAIERSQKDFYHVISKDKGYDPLIEHLRSKNLKVHRWTGITELPFITANHKDVIKDRIELVMNNLKSRKANLPKKPQTLANSIKTMFGNTVGAEDCLALVSELEQHGHISVDAGVVSYRNI